MAFNTVNECLRFGASLYEKEDAFLVVGKDFSLTPVSTRDFYHRARLVTLTLNAMGIVKGDRVALWSENRVEWALADMAILFAGAVTVPLYTNASAEQVKYILKDSGAKAIFVSKPELAERALALRGECPDLQFVFTFDKCGKEDEEKVLHLTTLELRGAPVYEGNQDFHRQLVEGVTKDDLASIVYTSGTTGEPKGVMLTHGNLASNLQTGAERLDLGRDDRALSFLPLCHIFERTTDYMYFFCGVTIAHVPDPREAAHYLRAVRPTVLAGVPRFYEKLYDAIMLRAGGNPIVRWGFSAARKYAAASQNGGASSSQGSRARSMGYRIADALVLSRVRKGVGRIRYFISGGAPLNPEIGKFFLGAGFTLLEGYGLTETSPVVAWNPVDRIKCGTVGKPLRGTEIKTEPDGELLVKGPLVMKGYWNKEEATKAAFTEDGWFRTGDLASIDADGYVKITGRKKELIKTSGGKYVAPRAVEERLEQSPYIEQACVFGDARKFIGALIVPNAAALQAKGISNPASAEALALIEADVKPRMSDLAEYEHAKRFVLLEKPFAVEDGTLTPTLKIRRKEIEKKYAERMESLYRG